MFDSRLCRHRFTSWPKSLNAMKNLQRLYLTANSITELEDMAVSRSARESAALAPLIRAFDRSQGIGAGCLTELEELSMDMNQVRVAPGRVVAGGGGGLGLSVGLVLTRSVARLDRGVAERYRQAVRPD